MGWEKRTNRERETKEDLRWAANVFRRGGSENYKERKNKRKENASIKLETERETQERYILNDYQS